MKPITIILIILCSFAITACSSNESRTSASSLADNWNNIIIVTENNMELNINIDDDSVRVVNYHRPGFFQQNKAFVKPDTQYVYMSKVEKDSIFKFGNDMISNPVFTANRCTDYVGEVEVVIGYSSNVVRSCKYSGLCNWRDLSPTSGNLYRILKKTHPKFLRWEHQVAGKKPYFCPNMTATTLKSKYDSIIFDLDGTLWDSTANVAVAWQAAKQKVDYIKLDIDQAMVRSITGLTYTYIFEKLFPYLTEEQRAHFKSICAVTELETLTKLGGDLYPQLEETLKYLSANYKLFLVSNCQNGYAEIFFNFSGLQHYFMGYQCFGTKGQPKAENIVDVVNDFDLKAPVYVGDTVADYEATVKAGVPFIFANYGFGKVEDGQVATIGSLAELQEIL